MYFNSSDIDLLFLPRPFDIVSDNFLRIGIPLREQVVGTDLLLEWLRWWLVVAHGGAVERERVALALV